MLKNRAGVLALVVLAIATILMVFVVLPQLSGGKKSVTDLANTAQDAVKDTAQKAAETADTAAKTATDAAKEAQSVVLEKMDRLKADATTAAGSLQGLFADGKVPTAEDIAAAKAKAEAALKAIVEVQIPEGIDATLAAGAKATTDAAAKSLALVQAIPADVEGARSAIAAFAAAMGLPPLPEPAKVAEPAAPAADAAPAAESAKPAETAAAATEAPKPADAAPAQPEDPTAKWVMPSFDVVRVEKDGSMVVAGRGEPGTKLQIMNGDTVIAATDVDPDGNFVAVLDNPLAPGDYALVLKLTDKNGLTKTSQQVATVSVPKDSKGQLLAMVTEAGQASRILATPDAPKIADAATAPAATAPAATTEIKTPELPAASNDIAGSAPKVDAAPATTAAPAAEAAPAAPAATADAKPATPDVVVTAVELEGDKIFIAGTTKPGLTVRAYADDKLVGEIKAEASGSFVVDGKMDLSVGTHTIRADALDDKGNVAFRAMVPFNRPEGEQVAVVAQADAPAGTKPALEMLGDGKFDQLRNEATKALGLLKSLFDGGKVPTGEQLAAARSSLQFALKSLAEFKLADGADAASNDLVARVASSANDALKILMGLPQDAAGVKAGLGALETAVNAVLSPNADKAAPAEAQAPAAPAATTEAKPAADATAAPAATAETAPAAEPAKPAATAEATQPATAEPKTTEQAPLQESKTSVIIRRGDTLWQISRRVYGKGIRYTTIYLANQDQIHNPDKISPGQIFGVPDKAQPDADAEAIHRKHLQQD